MKTLNASKYSGESLRAGQILTLSGTAVIKWIDSNGQIDGPVAVSNTTIGPFDSDRQLIVYATDSSVSYDISLPVDAQSILNSGNIPEYTWATKPTPQEFGVGQMWFSDINAMGYSDGADWTASKITKPFIPSSYVAIKSASTTVAGQSEKIASGVKFIYVKNLDATNTVKIGFGTSYATAETAAATSTDIAVPSLEFNFPVPGGKTHYAWLGVGGTVSAVIGQAD